MQREAVIFVPSCSDRGKIVVAFLFQLFILEEPILGWRSKDEDCLKNS